MRRFPFYLDQDEVDELAWVLARDHDTTNRYNTERPTPDKAFRLLSALRRQCCDRSGAADPFPHMPHVPGVFDGGGRNRRRM